MPTGTAGGYDKARETYARDNDKSNSDFFGNIGSSLDRGIASVGNAVGNFFTGGGGGGGGGNSYGGGGRDSGTPSYSAFSAQGLTSSDPANVARNRAAAERYAAIPPQRESENRGYMGRDRGIASLEPTVPVPPLPPVTPPTDPTTPTAPTPVGVPTMGYAGYDSSSIPTLGYGSAFAGLSQPMANSYGGMNLMDIFAMYPELQYI